MFDLKKIILPIVAVVIMFSFPSTIFTENNSNLWKKVSGIWNIVQYNNKNVLVQSRVSSYPWQYNEPLNYNSLMLSEANDYSLIKYVFEIKDPVKQVDLVLFFNTEFSETSKYHNLYAFRLSGNNARFNNCDFFKSHIIDTGEMRKKKNFKVSVLSSTYCTISTSQKLNCQVKIDDKSATLYVNDIKIQSCEAPDSLNKGIVGFGVRNAVLIVHDFTLLKNGNVLVHDDFSKDNIKRNRVIMKKISKEEYDRLKKQKQEQRNK